MSNNENNAQADTYSDISSNPKTKHGTSVSGFDGFKILTTPVTGVQRSTVSVSLDANPTQYVDPSIFVGAVENGLGSGSTIFANGFPEGDNITFVVSQEGSVLGTYVGSSVNNGGVTMASTYIPNIDGSFTVTATDNSTNQVATSKPIKLSGVAVFNPPTGSSTSTVDPKTLLDLSNPLAGKNAWLLQLSPMYLTSSSLTVISNSNNSTASLASNDSISISITYPTSETTTLDSYASVDGVNWFYVGTVGNFSSSSLYGVQTLSSSGLAKTLLIPTNQWGTTYTIISFIIENPTTKKMTKIGSLGLSG